MSTHSLTIDQTAADETVRWSCSCGTTGTARPGIIGPSGYRHTSQTARALAAKNAEGHARAAKARA